LDKLTGMFMKINHCLPEELARLSFVAWD